MFASSNTRKPLIHQTVVIDMFTSSNTHNQAQIFSLIYVLHFTLAETLIQYNGTAMYLYNLICYYKKQELPFDDGTAPPDDVVTEWFNLLRARFTEDPECCIAVHCIAGLGR